MSKGGSPRVYFVFVAKWHAIWFVVSLFCCALLFSGHAILGFLTILVFGFFLVRGGRKVARRVGSVRRTYDPAEALPELRVGLREQES